MFNFGQNKYSEIIKHQDEVVQEIFNGIEGLLKSQNQSVEYLLSDSFNARHSKWLDDFTDVYDLKDYDENLGFANLPFVVYNRYEIFAFLYKMHGWSEARDQFGEFNPSYKWCCRGRKFVKDSNIELLKIHENSQINFYTLQFGEEYRKYDYRTLDEIITFNGETFALVDIGFYS